MAIAKITRKKKETPIVPVLSFPDDLSDKLSDRILKRAKTDEEISLMLNELKESLTTVGMSLLSHKEETQKGFHEHKESFTKESEGHKKTLGQIEGELKEAFEYLWPRFEKLEKSIEENKVSASEVDEKHQINHEDNVKKIGELVELVEKRYQSALKKMNIEKKSFVDSEEIGVVKKEVARLGKLLKEVGKYEYGASLNILSGGTPIGFTGAINFKSGFIVALSSSGVDVTASTGSIIFPVSGAINNTNKTFVFAFSPTVIVVNGAMYRDGFGVTITGVTVVLDNAVGNGGDLYALF